MDRQEYLESLEALDKEYQLCKKEFIFEYCRTNNPYKKGDIVKDHQGERGSDQLETVLWHDRPRWASYY